MEKQEKQIGVALVGHKFMGKTHSHAYRDLTMFFDTEIKPVMKVLFGVEEDVRETALRYGWEEFSFDWKKTVSRDDIGLVDICSPNDSHYEVALAAAENKKHILCEKPLAVNLTQAREMLAAVRKHRVKHMTGFTYRFFPAVQLAKKLVSDGTLGKIYHFRAQYLQDKMSDPYFPFVWRMDKDRAGLGALGDTAAHCVDMARFLVGDFSEVVGMQETFIKERYLPEQIERLAPLKGPFERYEKPQGRVTVDDASLFLARFANGALGNFEATKFAPGHKNYHFFEINGSLGSIRFCFERLNELEYYNREDPEDRLGFRTILAQQPSHKYAGNWWPPGHGIGYEHGFVHEIYEMMQAIAADYNPTPDFEDGVKCQEVLTAVEQSVRERCWIRTDEV